MNIPSTTDDSSGKVYVIDPRHETIVNVGIPSRDRGAAAASLSCDKLPRYWPCKATYWQSYAALPRVKS